MDTLDWQPFSSFLDTLHQLCYEKRSGALYLISHEEHAGNISIREGEIIRLRYYTWRGENVIEPLRDLKQLSYRFISKSTKASKDDSLPGTDLILMALRSA